MSFTGGVRFRSAVNCKKIELADHGMWLLLCDCNL